MARKEKISHLSALFLLLSMVVADMFPSPLSAEERELLLFQEIPVITVASKKAQELTASPMPVVVIDEEEIRLSGAMNIPELLRRVAGVGVLAVSASDLNVSVRGLNMEASDKVLVMIDGRSVYLDFYGIVLWDALPVSMAEIRRIELIKGPGSSIYGGNAFHGVINIITKSPDEIDGVVFSLAGGERDTFSGSALYGKKRGDLGYKFSLSRDETKDWDAPWNDDSTRYSTSGNFAVGKDLGGRSSVALSGSIDESRGETINALDNFIRDARQSHLMLDYAGRDELKMKLFWNGLDTTVIGEKVLPYGMITPPLSSFIDRDRYRIRTDVWQAETTKVIHMPKAGALLLGANVSLNRLESYMIGGRHRQTLYSFFAEDEVQLSDRVNMTIGGRCDHHPLIGEKFSPRAGLVYSPAEGHHLKVSYATAYHLPTFVNSYLTEPFPAGNRDLDEERINAWNAGYAGKFGGRLDLGVDLFYNEVEGFIRWPGAAAAMTGGRYKNGEDFEILGGEAEAKFSAARNLQLLFNYAYLHVRYEDAGSTGRFFESPQSKINGGVNYLADRIEGSLFVHYVGETRWPRHQSSNVAPFYGYEERVGSYTLVNASVGYSPSRDIRFSLKGENILDRRHREFPLGDRIGRRIVGEVTCRF